MKTPHPRGHAAAPRGIKFPIRSALGLCPPGESRASSSAWSRPPATRGRHTPKKQLTTVITTRRLLALSGRLERGNEFSRALQVCVLNKVPAEDRKVIGETFDHNVGPLAQVKG